MSVSNAVREYMFFYDHVPGDKETLDKLWDALTPDEAFDVVFYVGREKIRAEIKAEPVCCFCGSLGSDDARPVRPGERCCAKCNFNKVIPARIRARERGEW